MRASLALLLLAASAVKASACSTPEAAASDPHVMAPAAPAEPAAPNAALETSPAAAGPTPPQGSDVAAAPTAAVPTADPSELAEGPARLERHLARRPPVDGTPRVYPKTRNVWVRGSPRSDTQWIGFLWFGSSVKLRDPNPIAGHGCKTWYAIEPRGYVCVDGERATLDPDDPALQEIFPHSPDRSQPNPHPSYGESIDAERYHHPPTEMRMRAREWDFRFHQARIATAQAGGALHESLLGIDLKLPDDLAPVFSALPRGMQEGHKRLIARSAVAWTREFTHEGRAMVLTDDLVWVPKDRIRDYPEVEFEGVHLVRAGSDAATGERHQAQLPLAFFRGRHRQRYRETEAGFVESGERYARLSWVELTGERKRSDDVEYALTRSGDWIRVDEAVIPKPRDKTPWGADVFGEDTTPKPPRGRRTWIDVSVEGGWMLAYEGTQPVFATLMSPGKGGAPHGNIPTLKTSSTPTGRFKITGKFVTATMIAPNELVHSAVPWAQNFSGPYAIHGAYWHDRFGEPMSGGCLNLSPRDGSFIFDFTEPRIPEGWHGVRWLPNEEAATTLLITR